MRPGNTTGLEVAVSTEIYSMCAEMVRSTQAVYILPRLTLDFKRQPGLLTFLY